MHINNKLFICTQSHTSGATFDENADKFTSVSDAGGQLAGTWDMTPVGATALPLDDTYMASVNQLLDGTYEISNIGHSGLSVVSSTSLAIQNSAIEFTNVINTNTYDPAFIYFGFINVEADLADFTALLTQQTPPSISGGILMVTTANSDFSVLNLFAGTAGTVSDGLVHTNGQKILFKYDILDGLYRVYAKVETNPTYQFMGQFPISSATNGIKPFIFGLYASTTVVGTFNITTLGGDAGSPVLPVSPVGKRYLVSTPGQYNNEHANVGDIVEFVNINDIIVTRDVNILQDSLDVTFSSLQQQIEANTPNGVKPSQIISGLTFQNTTNYFNLSYQLNSEVLVFDFGTFIDKTYARVQLSQKSFHNIDCIIVFKFDESSTSTNLSPNVMKLVIDSTLYSVLGDIEDATGGSGTSISYAFDLYKTRSLAFHYTNGRLVPIGRKEWAENPAARYKVSSPSKMSDSQVNNIDLTPTYSYLYPLTYSDTNRIVMVANDDINVASIIINRGEYTSLDSVSAGGIYLEINSNGHLLYNIYINYVDEYGNIGLVKELFTATPVSGRYCFVYFPKHNILVADINTSL